MAAGGRDFERALGAFLALDVGEVESDASCLEDFRLRPREHLRALEVVGELDERRRRDDLDLGASIAYPKSGIARRRAVHSTLQ